MSSRWVHAAKPHEEGSSRRGQWGTCHWEIKRNKREFDLEKQAVTVGSQSPPGLLGATSCLLNVTSPPVVLSPRRRMESHNACLNAQLAQDLLRLSLLALPHIQLCVPGLAEPWPTAAVSPCPVHKQK